MWFWAPSCPYCNQEAASVERFARDHAGTVTVVGLGSQENLGAARSFVTRHGLTSLKMLWDETGASWSQLGVVAQPEAVLFDRTGRVVGGWAGGFDAGAVLRLAAEPA